MWHVGGLTCLSSSSHPPGHGACAADGQSGSPAPGSTCTPHETAPPVTQGLGWRHEEECHSGTDLSLSGHPDS